MLHGPPLKQEERQPRGGDSGTHLQAQSRDPKAGFAFGRPAEFPGHGVHVMLPEPDTVSVGHRLKFGAPAWSGNKESGTALDYTFHGRRGREFERAGRFRTSIRCVCPRGCGLASEGSVGGVDAVEARPAKACANLSGCSTARDAVGRTRFAGVKTRGVLRPEEVEVAGAAEGVGGAAREVAVVPRSATEAQKAKQEKSEEAASITERACCSERGDGERRGGRGWVCSGARAAADGAILHGAGVAPRQ